MNQSAEPSTQPVLRILLLEDTPTDAELAEYELRKGGIKFIARREEKRQPFIEALESFKPDLVLSDYNLPDLNGLEALQLVQSKCPETPVIIVTGALRDIAAVELIHAGAMDYVLKEQLMRLAPTVKRVLSEVREIRARKQAESELRIAATAFESHEGMFVTDEAGKILRVNRAFTNVTGYSAEEAIGANPRLLKSGQHDNTFYQAMWKSILDTGSWEGEIWNRNKSGQIYPEHLTISAVKNAEGFVTHYVGSFIDITSTKLAEAEIRNLAFYDPLTHLPNRRLLLDRLRQASANAARDSRTGGLLFIDLDNFKMLNDSYGHNIGDMFLQQVARRLDSCVRQGDTVARLGGDEFVIMLENLSEQTTEAAAQLRIIGNKILAVLNRPYQLNTYEYHSSSSIGATLFNKPLLDADELLKQADIAMYQAKKLGRNTLCFFDPDMQANVNAQAALENELHLALKNQQFCLHYQPQLNASGVLFGAEALIRWRHPEHGLLSPIRFIPLAEETGLITSIGQWIIKEACTQLHDWQQDEATRHLTLSVNISARQFRHADFVSQMQAILKDYAIDPSRLKLELTESVLLSDIDGTIAIMNALNELGIQFALDDFGTGYSSLQYLKRLPIDQLKIDQSFVRDVPADNNDCAIVRTIIHMAECFNLNVIAEGVETEEQHQFLMANGCLYFQGYLFGKPMPIEQFTGLIRKSAALMGH